MKFKLDKKGISRIGEMCRRRVLLLQQNLAQAAVDYLLNFGYHSFLSSGPNSANGPGWSAYYAANWNVSVNNIDSSVITPERDPFDEEKDAYLGDLFAKTDSSIKGAFDKAKFGDSLFVTNSVYYGRWLNDGGTEFLTHNNESNPNRFIELCEAYLKNELSRIVKYVREES